MSGEGANIRTMLAAESDEVALRTATAHLSERLDAPVSMYSLGDGTGLEVRSTTADPEEADRSVQFSEVLLEQTRRMDRSVRIDDCQNTRSAAQATSLERTYRSALLVPVDDWGILVAAAERPEAFDDADLATAEVIADLLSAVLASGPPDTDQADERLETIASVLSHDLASPINVARSYVRETRDTGTLEYLEKAEAAIDRIEELTSGLDSFARTGRTVEGVEPVDLGEAATIGWSMVETADATLATPTDERVLADEGRLHQLFENLLSNAVDHGGSRVTVGSLTDRPGFYVEDDGPGIRHGERESVFDHGYTRNSTGSGFGLSIVEGIVEAHGWEIQVVEGEEGGARFEILT